MDPERDIDTASGGSLVPRKGGGKDVHESAINLKSAIDAGKYEVPSGPAPLVCKPRVLEPWRMFKIMAEFTEGFDLLGKYGLAATFFGTARASFDDQVYKDATELAARLAKRGFAVITGGASGVMQAANQGAHDAGGASVGLNIQLDHSEGQNGYLTDHITFDHFFVRKVMLTYASEVYVYFPGGFGTLDEFFEILTLVQTGKIKRLPIILYNKEYWAPLVAFFETSLRDKYRAIDPADLELFKLCDSVEEAFDYIVASVEC